MVQNFLQQALWDAAKTGDTARIRILVVDGVDVHAVNADGQNAIQIAIAHGQESAYKTLMAASEMQRLLMGAVKRAA